MQLKYNLEDRPPLGELILYGLQWFAIAVPTIIIIGKISAGLHFTETEYEIIYLQKLTFIMGAAILAQILHIMNMQNSFRIIMLTVTVVV